MKISQGKFKTKVPKPRVRPLSTHMFGPSERKVGGPSKSYAKDALREDPTMFGNIGFGMTGLTGES